MDEPNALAEMRRRDPGGVAIRRACRVAIVVPLTLVLLDAIPPLQDTALFGVFATLSLLVFADFGGRLKQRWVAYLVTVAATIPILVAGIFFGQTTYGAMIVMAVVTLALGLAAVLRGMLAAAQTTLLLATVLAVTSAPAGSELRVCVCWIIGGLIATLAASLMWPARPQMGLRKRLAHVYETAAAAVEDRWTNPNSSEATAAIHEMETALAALHGFYDGNLLRPAGLTNADRALAELVDIGGRLCSYQKWIDVTPVDQTGAEPALDQANSRFAGIIADELRHTSLRLLGKSHDSSPGRIKEAREHHLDAVSQWVEGRRHSTPATVIRQRLDDEFPLRLSSVSAELAAASSGRHVDFHDESLGDQLEHPRRGAWYRVKAQTSLQSPWLRNAIRTAVALAISVGVAKSLELGHAFWIVLGTLTALRFDALGTGRTAWQAFLGTTAGVALATVLILVVGGSTTVWWILLPISLFVAAYTPGTFSLATGQAGFSLCVLVLFSILYPATLQVAELRLIEVAIGLAVSLAISLVMWPRGVVATLFSRMKEAMDAATDHLVVAIDYIVGGAVDQRILDEFSARASDALDRAQEAFDLAVAQKPPETVSIQQWSRVANGARHVDVAAHLMPGAAHVVTARGAERTIPTPVVGPLLDASNDLRDQLRSAVGVWERQQATTHDDDTANEFGEPDSQPVELSPQVVRLREAIDAWLDDSDEWRGPTADPRPAMLTWIGDWTAFIDWSAERLRRSLISTRPV